MKLKKAVIPAAGFGTRMLPISSIVSKELLPVCGKPVIQYVVEEAVRAGIEEVILVLSKGKEKIAEYFTPDQKLIDFLIRRGKLEELRKLEQVWALAKITVVYQDEQKGLGHAVLCARDLVGNSPFAVLLGDSIVKVDDCTSFTEKLVSTYNTYAQSVVGVYEVEKALVSRYGVFEGDKIDENLLRASRVVEKPQPDETYSNLAFCSRYVFTPEIFNLLEQTAPGISNELQLTDAMQKLVQGAGLLGVKLEGGRYDIGDPKGLLFANLALTELGCD